MEERHSTGKNLFITAAILAGASGISFVLQQFATTDSHVPLLFVLAVLFVSRLTDGYLYGIVASMAAVVGVNYVFTYPYFAFDFTITGYPFTFLTMLAVSVSVSALTSRVKQQEQIRLEVEKEKMRANLLRAVSHDIRTPLTSIVGSASGILENRDVLTKENEMELVQDIREEAQWLIRIVENLLSVTRINGENARIDTQEEAVEEVISGAVVKFCKRFPDAKVQVDMPGEFLMVPMDGVLIEQVLVNLLENSILHGKTTTLIRIAVSHGPGRLTVAVEDDGQGIREAVLPVMFDGQISSSNGEECDSRRNMGIGLSVCRSIVKAHRGGMRAENKSTGGARVLFWLPMKEDDTDGY
ncbi:MAG: DUF4118 domain-containing protein [Eubacteriales bacterium]|nr:DUF4118 domain-containing protein [Eubacteriales bacterium]